MLWIDSRTGKVYHEIIQNFRGRGFWSMPAEKQRKGVLMMIELSDVRQAQERITPYILRTPLLRQPALDPILGCQVYLKHEGLQFTGSFKLRGATNALLSLTEEERSRGVVAASSGNHAQGVACAAQRLGVDAVIVMPTNVNPVKLEDSKANVTVMTESDALTAEEVTRIRDVLLGQCKGLTAQGITIVEVK